MLKLFTALSHAIEGAPLIAVAASFIWGILSIVLSPCHQENMRDPGPAWRDLSSVFHVLTEDIRMIFTTSYRRERNGRQSLYNQTT